MELDWNSNFNDEDDFAGNSHTLTENEEVKEDVEAGDYYMHDDEEVEFVREVKSKRPTRYQSSAMIDQQYNWNDIGRESE